MVMKRKTIIAHCIVYLAVVCFFLWWLLIHQKPTRDVMPPHSILPPEHANCCAVEIVTPPVVTPKKETPKNETINTSSTTTVIVPTPTPAQTPQPTPQPQIIYVQVPVQTPAQTPVTPTPTPMPEPKKEPEKVFVPAEITLAFSEGKIKWSLVAQEDQTCTLKIGDESFTVYPSGQKAYAGTLPIEVKLSCVGVKTASKVEKTLTIN